MTRILVVEDEAHLAAGLRFNLEAEGFEIDVEESGEAALDHLRARPRTFDLVLLDVMLPGIDGFDVVRCVRDAGNFVPVMILTARGQVDDVLRGFGAGADDYLPKPFDLAVLLARIRGLLRRKDWLKRFPTGTVPREADPVRVGAGRVDFSRQVIDRAGVEQPLTLMEATLLRYLVAHEGLTVDRQTLLEEVWGVRKDTDTRTIDNFVARLRRLIEEEPARPRHLLTVRGVGYRLVAGPASVTRAGPQRADR